MRSGCRLSGDKAPKCCPTLYSLELLSPSLFIGVFVVLLQFVHASKHSVFLAVNMSQKILKIFTLKKLIILSLDLSTFLKHYDYKSYNGKGEREDLNVKPAEII